MTKTKGNHGSRPPASFLLFLDRFWGITQNFGYDILRELEVKIHAKVVKIGVKNELKNNNQTNKA